MNYILTFFESYNDLHYYKLLFRKRVEIFFRLRMHFTWIRNQFTFIFQLLAYGNWFLNKLLEPFRILKSKERCLKRPSGSRILKQKRIKQPLGTYACLLRWHFKSTEPRMLHFTILEIGAFSITEVFSKKHLLWTAFTLFNTYLLKNQQYFYRML